MADEKSLEPMEIAGTTTYGGFFDLPGTDLYTVRLTIERHQRGSESSRTSNMITAADPAYQEAVNLK